MQKKTTRYVLFFGMFLNTHPSPLCPPFLVVVNLVATNQLPPPSNVFPFKTKTKQKTTKQINQKTNTLFPPHFSTIFLGIRFFGVPGLKHAPPLEAIFCAKRITPISSLQTHPTFNLTFLDTLCVLFVWSTILATPCHYSQPTPLPSPLPPPHSFNLLQGDTLYTPRLRLLLFLPLPSHHNEVLCLRSVYSRLLAESSAWGMCDVASLLCAYGDLCTKAHAAYDVGDGPAEGV